MRYLISESQLQTLAEARRDNLHNRRFSPVEHIARWIQKNGTDDAFLSFRDTRHVGIINLANMYNTPHGLYCYPLAYVLEQGLAEQIQELAGAERFEPAADTVAKKTAWLMARRPWWVADWMRDTYRRTGQKDSVRLWASRIVATPEGPRYEVYDQTGGYTQTDEQSFWKAAGESFAREPENSVRPLPPLVQQNLVRAAEEAGVAPPGWGIGARLRREAPHFLDLEDSFMPYLGENMPKYAMLFKAQGLVDRTLSEQAYEQYARRLAALLPEGSEARTAALTPFRPGDQDPPWEFQDRLTDLLRKLSASAYRGLDDGRSLFLMGWGPGGKSARARLPNSSMSGQYEGALSLVLTFPRLKAVWDDGMPASKQTERLLAEIAAEAGSLSGWAAIRRLIGARTRGGLLAEPEARLWVLLLAASKELAGERSVGLVRNSKGHPKETTVQAYTAAMNNLARRIGVKGFADLRGMGYIHPAEPVQAVVFDPRSVRSAQTIPLARYS